MQSTESGKNVLIEMDFKKLFFQFPFLFYGEFFIIYSNQFFCSVFFVQQWMHSLHESELRL